MSNKKLQSEEIIAVQDIVLEYILTHGWKDYNGFSRLLSEAILRNCPLERQPLEEVIRKFSHPFYSFNGLSKNTFINNFPTDIIIYRLKDIPKSQEQLSINIGHSLKIIAKPKSMVSIDEVFPEINEIDIPTGKALAETSLDIYERIIQNALRDYLREKNATNIGERKSDTSLEVADIEDFTLRIRGVPLSFSSVVKGYKSIGTKSVGLDAIAHQIWKANETHPDHILLVVAKPLADGVITKIVEYGKDCQNEHLVLIMDSVNLARFLRTRKVI